MIDDWLDALYSRHAGAMRPPELLKAIRALSVRYVQRRTEIRSRSPIDSAGKKVAFALFFAPLHFLITREIVRALGANSSPLGTIWDLGCGTGAASAAWASEIATPPLILGIDRDRWSIGEAAWNWRQLGLRGRTAQRDFVGQITKAIQDRKRARVPAVVAGWSVNELAPGVRAVLLDALVRLAERGTSVLIIEPIARTVTPWWPEWQDRFAAAGGRADEWRLETPLPAMLARLSDAAGFRREALTAKSLWELPGDPGSQPRQVAENAELGTEVGSDPPTSVRSRWLGFV